MGGYRILIADDHRMFCDALRRLIEDRADLEVVGEAANGIELIESLRESASDMVIADISMPGLGGIEATEVIKELHPQIKVLILTMHKDTEHFSHALSAGADGYLLKDDAGTELIAAIESIREGKVYISSLLSDQVVELLRKARTMPARGTSPNPLTKREIEVLKLLASGLSSKEIAGLLQLSIRTVEHHRDNMYKKLRIRNRADLIKYAIREGYASPE
jgi:two-component system, NarL family, response regulator NreC